MRAALAAGADWRPTIGPGNRDAAFSAAVCAGREPLEVLLALGVPLDHAHPGDGMLIHRAASFGAVDVIRMLVERGVAPDVRDACLLTPLAHARSSRHGERAVPMLIELMRAHGCTAGPAVRGDDLLRDVAFAALPPDAPAVLARTLEAFFTERLGGKAVDLLELLAEQRDEAALAAGIALIARASTAKPKTKHVQGTKTGKPKRLELVHHGDLELTGVFHVATLVVTGNLRVAGTLSNHEGCIVCVGGCLQAHAVWSEGPFWVGGNAQVRDAFAGAYNDYRATIVGELATPVLIQLDHAFTIGSKTIATHVTTRDAIPHALLGVLGIQKL